MVRPFEQLSEKSVHHFEQFLSCTHGFIPNQYSCFFQYCCSFQIEVDRARDNAVIVYSYGQFESSNI